MPRPITTTKNKHPIPKNNAPMIAITRMGPILMGKTIDSKKIKNPALMKFHPLSIVPGTRIMFADPHWGQLIFMDFDLLHLHHLLSV